MTVERILSYFQRMLDEHWAYKWGAARTGEVDCAGAFVWAFRQEGTAIYHGSNRMARTETIEMLPVNQAKTGMLAFKFRRPGENAYALPNEYRAGGDRYNGDLNDYYHVGLVDADANFVLNAQSERTGFVRSPISEGWDVVSYGKRIAYGQAEELRPAVVVAESGNTVNLRREPSRNAAIVTQVPVGAQVQAGEAQNGWYPVTYGRYSGYMMAEFVQVSSGDMHELLIRLRENNQQQARLIEELLSALG